MFSINRGISNIFLDTENIASLGGLDHFLFYVGDKTISQQIIWSNGLWVFGTLQRTGYQVMLARCSISHSLCLEKEQLIQCEFFCKDFLSNLHTNKPILGMKSQDLLHFVVLFCIYFGSLDVVLRCV